jgi:DNA-binding response OmpR family regulator
VRRTMRVLVVEDEKKVAKALREGLETELYDASGLQGAARAPWCG